MIFITLLLLTTAAIATSAAFFSVYGMAHLFTGAFIPVVIMGASLEAGKLVAASFLYRYSKKIGLALKIYLASAILVLMLVTSMGIFGFLTAAYQKDTLPLAEMQQRVELYQSEYDQLVNRRDQIDKQIADVGPNYVRAKQRLSNQFADERKRIDDRIVELTPEIQKLKTEQINVEAKVGPIMFVAEVMGKDPNTAVFWFTILLISVFDPLAVALTIAANIAIKQRQEEIVAKNGERKTVDMGSLQKYVDKQVAKATNNTIWQNPAPHAAAPATPSTTFLVEN